MSHNFNILSMKHLII